MDITKLFHASTDIACALMSTSPIYMFVNDLLQMATYIVPQFSVFLELDKKATVQQCTVSENISFCGFHV